MILVAAGFDVEHAQLVDDDIAGEDVLLDHAVAADAIPAAVENNRAAEFVADANVDAAAESVGADFAVVMVVEVEIVDVVDA